MVETGSAGRRKSSTDYVNLKADVRKLGKSARLLVRLCIVLLPMIVVLLQTDSKEAIEAFILSRKPFTLYEMTIVAWFACWVFGAPFDIELQEDVYIADADQGGISVKVIVATVTFMLVATGFLYLYKIEGAFQAGLCAFVLANFLALRVLNRRSAAAIARSREIMAADHDNFGLEKLRTVEAYLFGAWQHRRFAAMGAMAVLQLAVSLLWRFTSTPRLLSGWAIGKFEGATLAPYVPALLFIGFVAFSEGWIMRERYRTLAGIDALKELSTRYALRRKAGADQAPVRD